MINMRELLEHKKKNNKMSFYSYNQKGKNSRTIRTEFSTRETMKEYKKCSKCKEYKPFSEFAKGSKEGNQRGLQNRCKECTSKQFDNMKASVYKISFESAVDDFTIEYYGQTSTFKQRQRVHFSKLKSNTHANKKLQYEFNKLVEKYGFKQAKSQIKFEQLLTLTNEKKVALIELSESNKDYLSEYLLQVEKTYNDNRKKEVKESDLKVRVVS